MSTWAAPGVKCVCIHADWKRGPRLSIWTWLKLLYLGLPVHGGVYEVTAVGQHCSGGRAITLRGWGKLAFHADLFRPLISRTQEQDVALFAPLLNPAFGIVADRPAREGVAAR